MSWQQDGQYGGYSNYGEYSDNQYGSGAASTASVGDSASYDIFDNVDTSQQPSATTNENVAASSYPQPSSGYGASPFYDPGSYQPQPSYQQPPVQQGTHHRGPTPTNSASANMGNKPMFPGGMLAPDQLMANPMVTDMAMQYGQNIVGRGQEEIKKNLDKYVSIGQLKYYFAVDTTYVGKKLGILLFPFTRTDWAIKYNQDEPVQPKYDVNAPDLYIPVMAYVTYVLLVGYILGLRNAFSPDLLATTASTALVWLILEIGLIYLTLTVMSINTSLTKWDILAFSSYKYVCIIAVLVVGLLLSTKGYYIGLAYVSATLMFFLLRTLKLRIEPEVHGMQVHGKRKLYMILFYAILQPLLIWWMTYSLVPVSLVGDLPVPVVNGGVNGGDPFIP